MAVIGVHWDTNTGVQWDTVPKYPNPVNFHIKSAEEVLNILNVHFNLTLTSVDPNCFVFNRVLPVLERNSKNQIVSFVILFQ